MGPRSGKTAALAIPHVLSAPGPVAATSVRADLWAATSALRAQAGGTAWVFDPQLVTGTGRRWWWNPLEGLATKEAATRLAAHFVVFVQDDSRRDIWGPAARDVLCALFLAAGSSGRTLRDVDRWLADPASPVPSGLLRQAGLAGLAASLRGMQHGAPETRDGIYQTARTAAACLNDEEILPWVTPPRGGLPAFDPRAFAASRDTLYLIREAGTAAAPPVAALADAAMRAGRPRVKVSPRRQDILAPSDVRALPPGTALLFATGARAALLKLSPWYAGPDAARIAAATAAAEESIRRAACHDGPQDEPGWPEA